MSELKVGYKLLSPKLGSCTRQKGGPGYVQYIIGKLVKPPVNCGDLCLFGDKESAFNFKEWLESEGLIWECLYIPSDDDSIWVGHSGRKTILEDIREFCPNSILAKKIRLIREVKRDE
jgi:hypothetical protein